MSSSTGYEILKYTPALLRCVCANFSKLLLFLILRHVVTIYMYVHVFHYVINRYRPLNIPSLDSLRKQSMRFKYVGLCQRRPLMTVETACFAPVLHKHRVRGAVCEGALNIV